MKDQSIQNQVMIPAPIATEMASRVRKAFDYIRHARILHVEEMEQMRMAHQQQHGEVQKEINRGTRQTSGKIFDYIQD